MEERIWKIVERGISEAILRTHDGLIEMGGLYSQLYKTQFNWEKV